MWIKNTDIVEHTWSGQTVLAGEYYMIEDVELSRWQSNSQFITDLANGIVVMSHDNADASNITDVNEAINYLKGNEVRNVNVVTATEPAPFAKPDYRTKLNATDSIMTIAPGSIVDIDFYMTAERYVSGGELIVQNAKLGDYVTAEVVDKDGIIPEPYRPVLCENHPTIARYIEKAWITVEDGSFTKHIINTYPLNAKITPGLYLRVTYHSTAETDDRKIGITYHLTEKLPE